MRRTDLEITERNIIDEFLHKAVVIYIGFSDEGTPHVVPMNFGYDGENIYLHSAPAGRKIDILNKNPRVSFTAVIDDAVVPGEKGCNWSARYRSVMGSGVASFIQDDDEKKVALDTMMNKFAPGPFEYIPGVMARTAVIKIKITEIFGKQAGY